MTRRGGCLCGGVRYAIEGPVDAPVACHCEQCARTSGAFAMMAACRSDDLKIEAAETLAWFQSSETVRRGFCTRCGGNLFWKAEPGAETYVTAGTLDRPTGLRLASHIFAASKPDYYDLTDGLPQKPEW